MNGKRFVLKRDGNEVLRGTEVEVTRYVHKNHSYSLDHALRHEGYSLSPESPESAPKLTEAQRAILELAARRQGLGLADVWASPTRRPRRAPR